MASFGEVCFEGDLKGFHLTKAEIQTPWQTTTEWTLINLETGLEAEWTIKMHNNGAYEVFHKRARLATCSKLDEAISALIREYQRRPKTPLQ